MARVHKNESKVYLVQNVWRVKKTKRENNEKRARAGEKKKVIRFDETRGAG